MPVGILVDMPSSWLVALELVRGSPSKISKSLPLRLVNMLPYMAKGTFLI